MNKIRNLRIDPIDLVTNLKVCAADVLNRGANFGWDIDIINFILGINRNEEIVISADEITEEILTMMQDSLDKENVNLYGETDDTDYSCTLNDAKKALNIFIERNEKSVWIDENVVGE